MGHRLKEDIGKNTTFKNEIIQAINQHISDSGYLDISYRYISRHSSGILIIPDRNRTDVLP